MSYVPYDTRYVQMFFDFVRQAIGSTVNVIIPVFAIIVAVLLVTALVKMFTRA